MTEEAFTQFKKGELDRLKSGFFGISGEADQLYTQLTTFCYDNDGEIEWEKTANEIEAINALTFDDVKKFYKALFAPSAVPSAQKITPENYEDFKNELYKSAKGSIMRSKAKKMPFEEIVEHARETAESPADFT